MASERTCRLPGEVRSLTRAARQGAAGPKATKTRMIGTNSSSRSGVSSKERTAALLRSGHRLRVRKRQGQKVRPTMPIALKHAKPISKVSRRCPAKA